MEKKYLITDELMFSYMCLQAKGIGEVGLLISQDCPLRKEQLDSRLSFSLRHIPAHGLKADIPATKLSAKTLTFPEESGPQEPKICGEITNGSKTARTCPRKRESCSHTTDVF